MMMPFSGTSGETPPRPDAPKPATPPDTELTAMKNQLEQLQRQLDQLTRVSKPKS